MGKMIYALMTVIIVEMALYFFGGTTYASTSVFSLLQNPENLTSSTFYDLFVVALAVFAAATIIVGNFYQINIYGVYAAIGAAVLTFAISIVNLYLFVYGRLSDLTADFAMMISIFIIMPILLTYILAIVEWVRSN